MRERDGLLSFAHKQVKDGLILVLGIAIRGSLDSVFAKAAAGMLHEICGRMLVAFVEVVPNASKSRLAMASSARKEVERTTIEPFDGNIVLEE